MTEISLGDIWNVLKSKLLPIVFVTIVFGTVSFGLSAFVISPKYTSQARLLINIPAEKVEQQLNNSQLQANTRLIATYSDIIKDDSVIETAKTKAGITASNDTIRSMIGVNSNRDSQVFTVAVTSTDPEAAARLANALTDAFKNKVNNIYTDTETFVILSPAEVSRKRVSPNVRNNTILGLAAGLLLSILFFLLKDLLNTSVRDESIIEELGWVNLGGVSAMTSEDIAQTRLTGKGEAHAK